ncbi:MAG: hypothetical protein IH586_07085 [Anaerolineaceae bacterium]|nr:hypothetical protein [Anaerolineaceae bacterium]
MITVERFFWGHMLVAVATLSIGYAAVGWGLFSLGLVFLGVTWLAMQQRKSWGAEGMMLFAFVVSAGVGIYLNLPGWLMLLAVVASLGAWDLYHFLMRLNRAEHVEYSSGLGREHLRRLGLVELGGMLAGLIGLNFRLAVTFWWEVCFSILVVIGISVIIARIRKETE